MVQPYRDVPSHILVTQLCLRNTSVCKCTRIETSKLTSSEKIALTISLSESDRFFVYASTRIIFSSRLRKIRGRDERRLEICHETRVTYIPKTDFTFHPTLRIDSIRVPAISVAYHASHSRSVKAAVPDENIYPKRDDLFRENTLHACVLRLDMPLRRRRLLRFVLPRSRRLVTEQNRNRYTCIDATRCTVKSFDYRTVFHLRCQVRCSRYFSETLPYLSLICLNLDISIDSEFQLDLRNNVNESRFYFVEWQSMLIVVETDFEERAFSSVEHLIVFLASGHSDIALKATTRVGYYIR